MGSPQIELAPKLLAVVARAQDLCDPSTHAVPGSCGGIITPLACCDCRDDARHQLGVEP